MFDEPKILFWPVGNGDCTSIVVDDGIVVQVDIRDLHCAEDADDDHAAVVDKLVANLPEIDGKPYLSAFALTHPDQDHILGFADLLERVTIGEIWFTPRVFLENKSDLCDDAIAFKSEAERRVKETIASADDVGAGDRVRLIGYDSLLETEEFQGFPEERLTIPGNSITEVDGHDYEGSFNAFIHAPFVEEDVGDRNDTSLCMQILLGGDPDGGGVLLFGDIAYPRLRKIFDITDEAGNDAYLKWKVLLAPHHCSKSAMYQTEDDDEVLKQDILDDLSKHQVNGGYIVSSSEKVPAQNKTGDNPPHAKAKKRYEEVADGGFLCTQEDADSGEPMEFKIDDGVLSAPEIAKAASSGAAGGQISEAVDDARGSNTPPSEQVGYGGI